MITKRHLGYLFVTIGLLSIIGAIGAHLITERMGGFGALQAIGVSAGVVIILMAIPLIKLGNRPA